MRKMNSRVHTHTHTHTYIQEISHIFFPFLKFFLVANRSAPRFCEEEKHTHNTFTHTHTLHTRKNGCMWIKQTDHAGWCDEICGPKSLETWQAHVRDGQESISRIRKGSKVHSYGLPNISVCFENYRNILSKFSKKLPSCLISMEFTPLGCVRLCCTVMHMLGIFSGTATWRPRKTKHSIRKDVFDLSISQILEPDE